MESPPVNGDGGSGGGSVVAYVQKQLQTFRESDDRRDSFIREVAKRLAMLEDEHQRLTADLFNEQSSRRDWQRRCNATEKTLNTLRNQVDSKPFAVALIDGDGAPFVDEILQLGAANGGGGLAAVRLQQEIRKHLEATFPHSAGADWSCVVQIFTNIGGLARKLHACGMIKDRDELLNLIRDFNSTVPLFSFVDVGEGKERADSRMRESFQFYFGNQQCKHIIFGGCHDTGYDTTLRKYKHDQEATLKISLLETLPANAIYKTYNNFQMIRFESVFRVDPLPERPGLGSRSNVGMSQAGAPQMPVSLPPGLPLHGMRPQSAMPQVPQTTTPPAQAATSIATLSSLTRQISFPGGGLQAAADSTMSADVARTSSPSTTASDQPTWATVGRSGASQNTYSITPARAGRQKLPILYNAYSWRVDRPLATVSWDEQNALHTLIKEKGKLCNDYYLRGNCKHGDNCQYAPHGHTAKLTPGMLKALQLRARKLKCTAESCNDFDCYVGHHCFKDDCGKDDCKFSTWHGMDRHITHQLNPDGIITNYEGKQLYEGH